MKPKELNVDCKLISGMSVRTKNAREMNPEEAQLPGLWGKFYQEEIANKIPGKLSNSFVYGVYHNYESDFNGEYSVIAGVEIEENSETKEYSQVKIESGKYLVFEGRGEMPLAVINAWKEIWEYFSSSEVLERAYTTDFEMYKGPEEVDIYIAIK